MQSLPNGEPTVLHLLDTYLFITGSWVYSQITGVSKYKCVAVAEELANLEVFPLESIHQCEPVIPHPKSMFQLAASRCMESLLGFQSNKQAEVARKSGASILHAHFGPAGYDALPVKKKTGLPLITAFYGADACSLPRIAPRWRRRYRKLFEAGDLFLAEGSYMKKTLASLGCPEDKVVVQHLGVNLDLIPFNLRRPAEDGSINMVVVGTFREKKGITYALQAFTRVAEKRPNIKLTIIGDGKTPHEVEIKKELLKIIQEHSLDDRVRITGYLAYSEFVVEIQKAQIGLAPSVVASDGDAEGGAPVCLIEMSASGLPIIASHHCDIPEVIVDGKSGFLVPERDVEALAERMLFLVDNPDIWESMALAGRKHVEENYNQAIQVRRLEQIYDSLR